MNRFKITNLKKVELLRLGEGIFSTDVVVLEKTDIPVSDATGEVKFDFANNNLHLTKRGLKEAKANLEEMG